MSMRRLVESEGMVFLLVASKEWKRIWTTAGLTVWGGRNRL